MSRPIVDVDAQRARWRRHRETLGMVEGTGDDFGLEGLGRHVKRLDVRIVVLPADPEDDVLPLDGSALDWLKQDRPTPYGGTRPRWGNRNRATSGALVLYEQYRDDGGWDRYVAVHRHGGLELAFGRLALARDGTRIFPLRQIVGLAWVFLAMQAEAAERWSFKFPSELTVALRDTRAAVLGGFAEGWQEPAIGFWPPDGHHCIEDHVLLRWEFDSLEPEPLAIDVGSRIEQAFGTVHRRHLAHRGEYEGSFDPRFGF